MISRFHSVPKSKLEPSISIDRMMTHRNSPTLNDTTLNSKQKSSRNIRNLSKIDQWKSNQIKKYINYKVMEKGQNSKAGLQEIFLFHILDLYVYYIPIYINIVSENELILDFIEQQIHIKQLLKLKQMPKIWTLDGYQVKTFNQPISKIFYVNNCFDFWENIQSYNGYHGKFQMIKFNQLQSEIFQFTTVAEIEQFFLKPSRLKRYFFYETSTFSLPYIQTDTKIILTDQDVDKLFSKLAPEQKQAKVQMFQELSQQQSQRSTQRLSSRLISLPNHPKSKFSLEHQLLQGNISNPQEIYNTALEQVEYDNFHCHTERSPESTIQKVVNNPFQLKKRNDPSLIQMVNIDKIMMDFNISRRDVINYLTIFKCLMDQEKNKDKYQISKRSIITAYPYLAMQGCKCTYDTFMAMKRTKKLIFTFEDFVEVFSKGEINL